MAEGQVGAATSASEVPVYYVPKAPDAPNVFAALVSGFMQTRNPAAMMLFQARLQQMDPAQRVGELLRAAEIDADNQRTLANIAVSQSQRQASAFEALLKYEANILEQGVRARGQDVDASMKKAEIDAAREAKLFEPSEAARTKIGELSPDLSGLIQTDRETNPELYNEMVESLRTRITDAAAGMKRDDKHSFGYQLSQELQAKGISEDQVRDLHRDLNLQFQEPYERQEFRIGAGAPPAAADPLDVAERARQVAGILPEDGSTSASVRAPADGDLSLPAGGGPASSAGSPAPSAAPGAMGSVFQSILEAQMRNKGLGGHGDPIYSAPTRRDARMDAWNAAMKQAPKPPVVEGLGSEATVEGAAPPPATAPAKPGLNLERFLESGLSALSRAKEPEDQVKSWSYKPPPGSAARGVTYVRRGGDIYATPEGGQEVKLDEYSPDYEDAIRARNMQLEQEKKAPPAAPPATDAAFMTDWRKRKNGVVA